MKLTFCGGARTVTGSAFLLEAAGKKLLIDCGLFQGGKRLRARNFSQYPYNPVEIDYIILTHAHIDHSGLIPRLVKDGFRGRVLATPATTDLAKIMLPDSGHIQMMEAEWTNRKNKRAGRPEADPLYTVEDAEKALNYFDSIPYYQQVNLSEEIILKFYDAGHILGSAITELIITENGKPETVVFTGDLGKSNQPIIRDPDVLEEADYLIIEGTYGTRDHEEEEQKLEKLQTLIHETVNKQGNIVVPSFAVGRTQEMLYFMSRLMRDHKIPNIPIYIDSPLAISATEIFSRHPECFDLQMRQLLHSGQDPFHFPEAIFTQTAEESQKINRLPGGAMIISASGMADAGRIKHHLKHNLWREESTVLFVGYQAEGTLGRRIREGRKKVKIFGEEIMVRARIEAIDGFSAHADRTELLKWLGKFQQMPKQVILVHGEEDVLTSFSAEIEKKFGVSTYIPNYMETMELKPLPEEVADTSQVMAKLKARELLREWLDFSEEFTSRLELALLEEDDEERLLQLEKELESIKGCLVENF
ncbi:MBL fold metallo-hydrolase RNA specificity domain-containing protein [Dethiobacter alkaliphilus]|uniref:MBL fold metallo-hydrolase RNA specificity domain-containing protein n=1 Tax=Dethiobacter alkaliphilus TaxID=427926 RepID=UPI002226C021|nr:MBL fold metallo-hydrolase [Dethiobacter alkaliphilus]MCW3488651.1 MBL fold metallo-hydrolase [Dethiobacter alkaliphilus]